MKLYNTLSKKVEEVHPLESGVVRMYSCGPTVYRYAHLGNLRSYLMSDWIRRALENQGLRVIHVKNITDVGHMRQEMLEQGEDKVIAAAIAEGKTPQEIAQFYTDAFHRDEERLGILQAAHFPMASQHIGEMIQIVKRLEERGYTYEVEGNVYFSVSSFSDYGKLSGNTQGEQLEEGVRVETDPLKHDPRDFTLWKAAEPGRALKWPSPWGDGFPGWHIECSAMSTKYLGEQLDIHTGGVDNIFPHHEGEIAQSEGAFDKRYVQLWVHGQHLLADGVKMAKSVANDYTLEDLETRGFDPLAFRYLCLTTRYRTRLNFTFSALRAAGRGLERLKHRVWEWSNVTSTNAHGVESERWRSDFWDQVNDDLDMPGALALTWTMVRSDLAPEAKLGLLLEFDGVLGLRLDRVPEEWRVPPEIENAEKRRAVLRASHDYVIADGVRRGVAEAGFVLEDNLAGARARPESGLERRQQRWSEVSSSKEVSSLLDVPDQAEFSVGIVACNYLSDVQRCVHSVLPAGEKYSLEVVVVDNGSTDGTSAWLDEQARKETRLRVIHTDHVLGEAAARNILLKQSRGKFVVLMDTSVEAKDDFLTPVAETLANETVGVVGPWGLRTEDLQNFSEIEEGDADAMQAYCFAFPRSLVSRVGLMRESFRFYRNLDIEYSFQFLDQGYRIVTLGSLPLERHEHRVWSNMSEEVREKLSRDNFRRFHKRWGHRSELLVDPSHYHHD